MAIECEICKIENKRHDVFRTGRQTTNIEANPFYDKGGNYHWHDPNIVTEWYRCSNHHQFKVVRDIRPCPSCIFRWMEKNDEGIS